MESVLIVITLVSLTMTIVLATILVRLIREERRRSDARVAMLREMADAVRPHEAPPSAAVTNHERLAPAHEPTTAWDGPIVTADDVQLNRTADVESTGLFEHAETASPWPRRLAVAAALAILVTLTGLALRSRPTAADPSGPATTRAAEARAAGLLELLSLEQTQQPDALRITGLVQNPRDGAVLSKVMATAHVFGPDGALVASGRAALDFSVLRPGDESIFVINVPVGVPVARYRVGFRSEDGRVIGHVDKRVSATMAHSPRLVVALPPEAS